MWVSNQFSIVSWFDFIHSLLDLRRQSEKKVSADSSLVSKPDNWVREQGVVCFVKNYKCVHYPMSANEFSAAFLATPAGGCSSYNLRSWNCNGWNLMTVINKKGRLVVCLILSGGRETSFCDPHPRLLTLLRFLVFSILRINLIDHCGLPPSTDLFVLVLCIY